MNYKNIISTLFIAMIFAGGISCTNKTKSAKQGNDSIAADSVAATDNEEPVDVVISPEKSKKGNVTKFTFNYSGKEVNVIADVNEYEYYVKIDNKKYPLKDPYYSFSSIEDCRICNGQIWIICETDVAGIYSVTTSNTSVLNFNIDKKTCKNVVNCDGAKFNGQNIEYKEQFCKNKGAAQCAAEYDFAPINRTISLDGKKKKPTEKEIISFIKDMYNGELYDSEYFLEAYCTNSLLKYLSSSELVEEGYATWLFQSSALEGPSKKHGIISIKPLGNSWYQYTFYDRGNKAENKIKVIIDGTTIKFDKVEQLTKF